MLADLREFGRERWDIQYPKPNKIEYSGVAYSVALLGDPAESGDLIAKADEPASKDLHVLRLDLSMGLERTCHSSPLISSSETASVAQLVGGRLDAALTHINKLKARVADTYSKVLITGDLNVGKSTLVNALLHRDVLPMNEQPMTSTFCEVYNAIENGGAEEVHVVNLQQVALYDRANPATFTRALIDDLEKLQGDPDAEIPPNYILKVYVSDSHLHGGSLPENGIADIVLIDAPGFNHDSLHTATLFACQEDIDVIVLCVSAGNRFTLSAQEFLRIAGNEKAYVFVVVNQYDQIKDKDRCKRRVYEQIRALSPRTYDDRHELVHFVDSRSALGSILTSDKQGDMDPAFGSLETALRSFVLLGRFKSKLAPAQTYLTNLLSDMGMISSVNALIAKSESNTARLVIERSLPILKGLKSHSSAMEAELEALEENTVLTIDNNVKKVIADALADVAKGKLDAGHELPPWRGFLQAWDYAREVRIALLESLDRAVERAEAQAEISTAEAVQKFTQVSEQILATALDGAAGRQFHPLALAPIKYRRGRSASAPGLLTSLSHTSELNQATIADVIDFKNLLEPDDVSIPPTSKNNKLMKYSTAAISFASLTLGAVTMISNRTFDPQGIVQAIEMLGNKTISAWVAPAITFVAVGGAAFPLIDLPNILLVAGERIVALFPLPSHETEAGPDIISPVQTIRLIEGQVGRIIHKTRATLNHWLEAHKFLPLPLGDETANQGSPTIVSLASFAFSTAAMVSTNTFNVNNIVPATELLKNDVVRSWVTPVSKFAAIGGAAWLIFYLPRRIPRTIGRRIVAQLRARSSTTKLGLNLTTPVHNVGFIEEHATRIGQETRKALTLAAWDVRQRYRAAEEDISRTVKESESKKERAEAAWSFFIALGERVAGVRIMSGLLV